MTINNFRKVEGAERSGQARGRGGGKSQRRKKEREETKEKWELRKKEDGEDKR